ncbi:hypothetical protein [Pseudonocardia sp. GCM10023141]|uniref:hypothetical protein n=1 Tax=Pseudonocardia sp. GCM10023141 TaxID=3252653 RepID=UPI0036158B80
MSVGMRRWMTVGLAVGALVIALAGVALAIAPAATPPASAVPAVAATTTPPAPADEPVLVPGVEPVLMTSDPAPATRKPVTGKPATSKVAAPGCAARAMATGRFDPGCAEYQGYLDPGTAGGRAPTSGEIQQENGCKQGYIPADQC